MWTFEYIYLHMFRGSHNQYITKSHLYNSVPNEYQFQNFIMQIIVILPYILNHIFDRIEC